MLVRGCRGASKIRRKKKQAVGKASNYWVKHELQGRRKIGKLVNGDRSKGNVEFR